jgi:hypothetical protein
MKQLAIVSFVSLFGMFFSLHVLGQSNELTATQEAIEIMKVMEENDIAMNSWNFYTRQSDTTVQKQSELNTWLTEKKAMLKGFTWSSIEEDDHGLKVTAMKKGAINEKIIFILYGQKEKMSTYSIYEISGTKWNDDIANEVNERIKSRTMLLFGELPATFTCIKGDAGDKMVKNLDEKANILLNAINAKTVESISEKNFVSYSAYSESFTTSISTNNNAMNVQLAMRSEGLGGKTTVVFGTPIITIEY